LLPFVFHISGSTAIKTVNKRKSHKATNPQNSQNTTSPPLNHNKMTNEEKYQTCNTTILEPKPRKKRKHSYGRARYE